MVQLPMKAKLLKTFNNSGPLWDYEAVEKVLSEEGLSKSEHWRMTARFWLMEMSAGGMITSVEETFGKSSYFVSGKIEYQYKLTDFGKMKIKTMLED